jgi:hypothetical protein
MLLTLCRRAPESVQNVAFLNQIKLNNKIEPTIQQAGNGAAGKRKRAKE